MKIVWTNEALKKLIEIEDYIAADSPNRAQEFILNLINRAESLTDYPEAGRVVPEFVLPEIREILLKNYRIVYRIKETRIEILTVFEGHRLLRIEEVFQKRKQ
jgi:addiction module RelE/StbE family toxin